MSAPPENALPAPVMTMALTRGYRPMALAMPSAMPWRVDRPRPLTGGLFERDDGDIAVDLVVGGHAGLRGWVTPK